MTYEKDTAPLQRVRPPHNGGFYNKRSVAVLAASVVGIGALAAWGFSIRGEEPTELKTSDVQVARIDVSTARPFEQTPALVAGVSQNETTQSDSAPGGGETRSDPVIVRKGPPEGFQKLSPVVMRGNRTATQQGMQQVSQQTGQGRRGQETAYAGQEGYRGGEEYENGRESGRRSRIGSKEQFYAGGGNAYAGGLDIEGQLVDELPGCVVKAGAQITLQTRSKVRTTLPQKVLGYVVNPVEGNHYLGGGAVERCLAIPAGSTVLSEVNTTGVERGDLRIQACALRLDLLGGGRRVLGCQPAHGSDGGAGIEASSDYAVSGIMTGIVIEAALASARGLGGLIAGPAGIAVQVGTGMVSDVGAEYVRRELMRPPVLTMEAGAIWGIQLNGDLSLPMD